ncbi:MAG: SPOR domain-containing protein [Comamonas sp.]
MVSHFESPSSVGLARPANRQRGGTVLGLILGLVVGLAVALVLAVYVNNVPVPFLKRGPAPADTSPSSTAITPVTPSPSASAGSTANTPNWDPNSPLYGRQPAPPSTSVTPATPAPDSAPAAASAAPATAGSAARPPAARGDEDPLGRLALARSGQAPTDTADQAAAYSYFVQAGAFSSTQDAEAQKAKLSFSGITSRVTQREQNGRPVYRVRSGPYTSQQEAEALKARLAQLGVEAALVRVQR